MSAAQFTPSATPPVVLCFSAADPTGGAGLQADLLTIASLGCHPLSVITALTVQDTAGVEAVLPIDAGWIADQARALLEDIPVAAFKLGMLGSVEIIAAIAAKMELMETILVMAAEIAKTPNAPNPTNGFNASNTPKLVATDFPPVKFSQTDLL